jgi:hypothetical protein
LGNWSKFATQIQEIQEIMLRRSKIQFAVGYSIGYLGQSVYPFGTTSQSLEFYQILQGLMHNFIETK